jgi:outer membrane murein-binding lipoprotein Lpp
MLKLISAAVVLAAISLSACISTPLAPGAEQVKITRVAADVSSCKALGNLDLDAVAAGIDNARNHAIGLGGNTVLDTTPTSIYGTSMPLRTGVIYRCDPAGSPTSK